MYQIRARMRRDIPYCDLSRRHPDSIIRVWCNFERDIIETESPNVTAALDLRDDMDAMFGTTLRRIEVQQDRHLQAFGAVCSHDFPAGVTRVIEQHDGLRYEPLMFRAGWQYFSFLTVVVERVQATLEALSALGEMEVLSKTRLPSPLVSQTIIVPVESLLADLTDRQASALNVALSQGYYEIPRRQTVKEVAARLDVPRTTYEQHLRKAENKVIRAIAPYLRLVHPAPEWTGSRSSSEKEATPAKRTKVAPNDDSRQSLVT